MIVFEAEIKHGAYELRKKYGRSIVLALLISVGLYIMAFFTPMYCPC
jgi:hypothetical protein